MALRVQNVSGMRTTWKLAVFGALLSACAPPGEYIDEDTGETHLATDQQEIVGGVTETGDPAVVFLYIRYPSTYAAGCTGTVIAPRVVLTAAHCLLATKSNLDQDGRPLAEGPETVSVVFGNDFRGQAPSGGVANSGTAFFPNPAFLASNPAAGHDTGIVYLASDAPVTPLGYGTSFPTSTWFGSMAHLVGFGITSRTATDSKLKRSVDLPVVQVSAVDVAFNPTLVQNGMSTGPHGVCHGDSGGPAMFEGEASVFAVASRAEGATCSNGSYFSRVDADLAFINAKVAAAPSSGSGGSGGTTPPPKTSGCELAGHGSVPAIPAFLAISVAALFLRRRRAA